MNSMLQTPEISIIVPVYNGGRFIPGLLQNLKSQTYQNFEIVIVNDGSTDETPAILEKEQATMQGVPLFVIHQENKGVSAARNTGLCAAKGKYVCFVDADDVIATEYLEILHDALQMTGLRVAAGHITRQKQELFDGEARKAQAVPSYQFLRQFLYEGAQYHICACMFDRRCFTERQICFPEGYRYSEDVFVLWQVFAAETAIAEVHEKLYYYYDNPVSAMNSGIDLRRLDAIRLMQRLEPIIAELNPEFSPEFDRYVVARHHWSILWQAANRLDTYKSFREYSAHFNMRSELRKLFRYPELRISLSSFAYVLCPPLYYYFLRIYFQIRTKNN